MENENKKEEMGGCGCPCCKVHGMMHGKMCYGGKGRHCFMILRVILLLVIIACIFSFGVKLGEFKSYLYGSRFEEYNSHHEMMKYLNYGATPTCGSKTATPTTTP